MNPISNQLIDLHKYLVAEKLIPPFQTNHSIDWGEIESYENSSHLNYLYEGNWFKNLPKEFNISKEMFLTFCTNFYDSWEIESQNKLYDHFEEKYSNDKNFIKDYLNKTEIDNELFCRASESLQSDYELLKLFLGFSGYYNTNRIIYLHENIQNNRALMLKSLADFPEVFCDLNEEFRNDEEFATLAIKHNGLLLEFAGKKIKDNEDLVALAIKSNIKAVLFASKRLREFPDGMFYEHYWHVINDVEFK
jgi:hypothetical protein